MKNSLTLLTFFLLSTIANAQLFVGAGFGTFKKQSGYKGYGPTVSLLYSPEILQKLTMFLNTSLYNKNAMEFGTVTIYDNLGSKIGEAQKSVNVRTIHYQFGFMCSLGDKENAPKPNFFLGAGLALSKLAATYNYDMPGHILPSDEVKKSVFGFNFNAGVHSQVKKLVIELKGNFDFMLGHDIGELDSDALPHVNSTRLSFYYPLTR